ncbi:universal stress protein [Candidatus Halobonum tyrrellensis]|uniref:Universal stress family protein n=1 Tax=Candidatus Halobonum tyrrellensis G22 TaxID=1324957 RepID=V4HFL5_9EURY|nr:universal stress protein [Candidatus Halobonum tyrrellensis]ESP89475.1 universal stress family protein [Candidatus Halobonum tyrrellensis G22]
MTRVLVPTAILEGESVPFGLMDLLGTVDVTVLGYHVVPEQTPPDQARMQYEERAVEALEDVAEEFHAAGGDADHRLVFTPDRAKTVQRVAEETGADAYTIRGTTGSVERLLVPLSGDVAVERVLSFVTDLIGGRDIGVTLLLATDDESDGRDRLTAAADRLAARGVDVRTELAVDDDPVAALVAAVPDHDAVVMGERAPSVRSFLFGEEAERVAAETVGPVLVVRRDEAAEE